MLLQGIWYFPVLVAAVALYWCLPVRARPRLVYVSSASIAVLAFLLWRFLDNRTGALLLAVLSVETLAVYAIGRHLAKRPSSGWLVIGLVLPLAAVLAANCRRFGLCQDGFGDSWLIPVSMGFFVLRHAHYVYESFRGNIREASLPEFLSYMFFFPTIIAGPLERFPRLTRQAENRFEWTHITEGAERIAIGCFKKFVLADLLLAALLPPSTVTHSAFVDVDWGTLVFACAARFLYVYVDFSGYTDMAIGTARLFGFKLVENFDYPLLRSNLAEFWRAWHISLSTFARDYVYFPLLAKYRNTVLALIATMLAIASWHGTSPGWLLWGLHHGVGLALLARFQRAAPKYLRLQALRETVTWRIAATGATLLFVSVGYALTWHPENLLLSLRVYARLWSLGAIP